MNILEKREVRKTPLGQYIDVAHGYFMFPELEGDIGAHMRFRGKVVITWSINNYLGLANHPEVRKADADASERWGLAYPMGARIMSGQTKYHRELEEKLAALAQKEDAYLLNFGYQGMVSVIDQMLDRHDVVVYDEQSHACIIDGLRLHMGKRLVFSHNDMEKLEKQLQRAQKLIDGTPGGIMVVTEGVFGMAGDIAPLDKIVELKKKYDFTLLVDDAHGFGTMGKTGAGAGEHLGCQDGIDLYFGTFAKAMAGIGGFIAGNKSIIDYLRYNLRSQVYAKSLPLPMVIGSLKRLELLIEPGQRKKLWDIVNALQSGLREKGFNLGNTSSPVTPVFFSGNAAQATNVIIDLRENYNIFTSVVVYPVVPRGVIMLRLIPTADHSIQDVEFTINAFAEVYKNLIAGKYDAEEVTLNLKNSA